MFKVTPVKWKQPVASERALDGVTGGLMDTMKRAVHKNTPQEEIAELKFQNTNLQRQLAGQPPLERPPELGGATPDDNPANWANLVMRIEVSVRGELKKMKRTINNSFGFGSVREFSQIVAAHSTNLRIVFYFLKTFTKVQRN